MAGQARRLLADTAPITVILGRVLYHARAVMLAAQPPSALEPVLHAVQEATRIVTGRDGELHHEPWTPHVTLAYANTARSAGPVIEALGQGCTAAAGRYFIGQPGVPGTRANVDMAPGG